MQVRRFLLTRSFRKMIAETIPSLVVEKRHRKKYKKEGRKYNCLPQISKAKLNVPSQNLQSFLDFFSFFPLSIKYTPLAALCFGRLDAGQDIISGNWNTSFCPHGSWLCLKNLLGKILWSHLVTLREKSL